MHYAWIGLMVLFLAVEAGTVGLVSIWFAGGALVGLVVSLLGGSPGLQVAAFLVVSVLLILLFLPVIKRRQQNKAAIPTNADRIIGMKALVTEKIDQIQGTGAVKVDGKIWSARTDSGDSAEEGALVKILRIEGVKVIVEPESK